MQMQSIIRKCSIVYGDVSMYKEEYCSNLMRTILLTSDLNLSSASKTVIKKRRFNIINEEPAKLAKELLPDK